jgi:transglutaminase-like putative cysteine protease/ubiquinone/menaquinone biosynthesis C-methylase UbiE
MRRTLPIAIPLLLVVLPCLLHGQTTATTTTTAPVYETRPASRDGIGKFYMGREIAHVMGHQGADWLERPEREREEGTNLLIDNMDLKPADVVADIGAGTGYMSFRMAKKVPDGKVLAVDIQQEMLDLLSAKSKELGVKNVEPVLGRIDDPKLPAGSVDAALFVDAYHEFSHPREMMEAVVRALKPGGRVVLVEYRAEDPNVPIKSLHKMTEAQAKREMAAVGLAHVETKHMLPWQHLMIFRKTSQPVGSRAMNNESTGASFAFTSNDPIVKQAIAMMTDGKFAEAQSLLASADGHASPEVARAREEMKEVLRRTRREYSVDAPELLKKIQKDIPDATAQDLERWTKAGLVQDRTIDGQLKYFRREPANVYRFSEEAKKRKEAAAKPEEKKTDWTLIQHLSNVIAAAEESGKADVLSIRHRIDYTVTIPANTRGAKAGSQVRVWLPFPQEYRRQTDIKLLEASPKVADFVIADNGAPHRTVCFTHTIDDPSKELTYKLAFQYTSAAYYPILKDELAKPLPADFDKKYLDERPPHIAFSPQLNATVAKIVGDETNPLAKVRRIFHWIDDNIKYHAEEEYGVIPSFSGACLTRGRGDCGVQAILFVTMCRAAGVPARWQSGWETKRDKYDMHDWAEFYVEPWGWLPADPSYGVQKKSDNPKVRDFYIGHQDSYRLIVNLDYGRPLTPPKQTLRSEPADFQRGEVEIDGRNLYFDEWDYDFVVTWLTAE